MAIGRGRFSERILEKAPRTGRKKVSKKKTPKVAAKPRLREDIQIDIPEIINIPGIGQIELPKAKPKPKPKAKAKPKAKPKPKPKAKAKVKARPKPKPRPVKLPDILQEDIRISPGMLEGLIAKPVVKAKEKPKPKKEVKTPKKGKVREREDIRVPTREEIDKVIKDLDIKIPEVINIPGVGQVTIPAAPKPPVETSEESAPRMGKIVSGPVRTSDDTKGGIFGRLPDQSNLSELDKLKQRFDMLTSMRFVKDPGPEHYQKIKELGDQIYALDKNFKSEYYTPPSEARIEFDEGPKQIPQDVIDRIEAGRDPSPDLPPAPEPPIRIDTTPEPTPPTPPQFIDMDPLKGMRDTIIPRNILGQSFDPSVRDDYEKQMQAARAAMMQPGGNIRATEYPTYQTPTLAVPQTQFGGYGQPMPVAPLLPYAGLATATPPQEIPRPPASGARVNPGTGQIEPEGIAPPPRVTNLPPGVTGPIR